LRPRSIAVIGGGFFGSNVVKQSRKMGFAGDIWPVHPSKTEIEGTAAYSSLADLPGAPDAAFVAVNRHHTIEAVRELARMRAGGAVCFASGFREAAAEDANAGGLQDLLVEAAGEMPLIGPNCYGLINYADGALLWPDQHGGRKLAEGERGVAIITQSSNIAINMTMQRRGLPLAYVMTAGNQAQTGLSELALGMIEDSRVSALGLHIEGFDSVAGFERLAQRARELRKPVVAMKVGRSEQARAATISHTASLAGSDAASSAFLRRLGIARVDTIASFLETLKFLHVIGPLYDFRMSSMSCSGGEASIMADSVIGRRIHFPELSPAHREEVRTTLGPMVAVANPLDYHTFIWNNEPAMTRTFTAMVAGRFDLNMLVLDFPRVDRCTDTDWWPTVHAFEKAIEANGAAGAIVASIPENLPEAYCGRLIARGIAPLCGVTEAIDAAEAAATIGENWKGPQSEPVGQAFDAHLVEKASSFRTLNEAEAKSMLAAKGLRVPEGRVVNSPAEAAEAAVQLGYPVALKALGVAHKTEMNALQLNLRDETAVRTAAADLEKIGTGLYVERMIEGAIGELIIGVTGNPLFGPVMTIGTGGVLVELLQDSKTLLLPASRDEIHSALRGLKLFPLLSGYRGRQAGDLDAAVEMISMASSFACEYASKLVELDINPLIICAKGAFAADALMVVSQERKDAPPSAAMEEQ
jgi:acyl-CoA synthetase (NDP forming)